MDFDSFGFLTKPAQNACCNLSYNSHAADHPLRRRFFAPSDGILSGGRVPHRPRCQAALRCLRSVLLQLQSDPQPCLPTVTRLQRLPPRLDEAA
jgi:hypothetical protein